MITNPHPTETEIKSWGMLAYVSVTERNRIMSLPYNHRRTIMSALHKEVGTRK